jgi:hypothetical protein
MMDVRRIKQRNEHIDVEQSDQRRLHFVPEPIYGLQCDESRALAWRQNRHTITLARGSGARHQSTAGKVGKHAPGSGSAPGRKLFGRLKHVLIDIQSGSHQGIIAHQTSEAKAGFRFCSAAKSNPIIPT